MTCDDKDQLWRACDEQIIGWAVYEIQSLDRIWLILFLVLNQVITKLTRDQCFLPLKTA